MLRRAARLAVLARAGPPLQRRFCAPAAPPLLRASADGATACRALALAAPGEAPAFAVFASRRTLEALGGAAGFVDLPPCEAQLAQGRPFAMLESSAGRVVLAAPLSGEVLRRNEALLAQGAAAPLPRPGDRPEPLWLLDVACADEAEWEALQPDEAQDGGAQDGRAS
jgi:glycine cleavage system H lipoate-binding protein